LGETVPGKADRLAGESAAEQIDRGRVGVELSDVGIAGHVPPVSGEHSAAPWIGFALPGDAHSGSFEAEVEATDAREEASDIHDPPGSVGAGVLDALHNSRPTA
jgi:hypothetical protein